MILKNTNPKKKIFIIVYFFLTLSFIFLLYVYTQMFHATSYSAQEFLNNPIQAKNETKTIMGTYVDNFSGGFYLKYNHQIIKIHTVEKYTPPKYGELVVKGIFHPD